MRDRDRATLERFRGGDADAFRELCERHAPRMYTVLARIVGDKTVAEDLLDEAFIQIYGALDKFQGAKVSTWMYRLAINRAINWIRKTRGKVQWEATEGPLVSFPSEDNAEDNSAFTAVLEANPANEPSELLGRALETLSEGYRIVFTLREMEGMETDQIAEILECSQDAVNQRLQRAKRVLKERLRPYLEAHIA